MPQSIRLKIVSLLFPFIFPIIDVSLVLSKHSPFHPETTAIFARLMPKLRNECMNIPDGDISSRISRLERVACLASNNALDILILREEVIGIRDELLEKKGANKASSSS
jgi:hypothetical protein